MVVVGVKWIGKKIWDIEDCEIEKLVHDDEKSFTEMLGNFEEDSSVLVVYLARFKSYWPCSCG